MTTETKTKKPGWTDARITTLETMWRKGISGTKIAEELGLSRSAINAKAFRLNLPKRSPDYTAHPRTQIDWNSNRVNELRKLWRLNVERDLICQKLGITSNHLRGKIRSLGLPSRVCDERNRGKRVSIKSRMPEPYIEPPIQDGIALEDLQECQCRHVVDPTRFAQRYCGKPAKEGSSYCEEHHAANNHVSVKKPKPYNFNRVPRVKRERDPYQLFDA